MGVFKKIFPGVKVKEVRGKGEAFEFMKNLLGLLK